MTRGDNNQVFPALARASQPNRTSGRGPALSESSASRPRNECNVVAPCKPVNTI